MRIWKQESEEIRTGEFDRLEMRGGGGYKIRRGRGGGVRVGYTRIRVCVVGFFANRNIFFFEMICTYMLRDGIDAR